MRRKPIVKTKKVVITKAEVDTEIYNIAEGEYVSSPPPAPEQYQKQGNITAAQRRKVVKQLRLAATARGDATTRGKRFEHLYG